MPIRGPDCVPFDMHDLWDVLDEEDALLTEKLEDMVESGELQPYAGATLA